MTSPLAVTDSNFEQSIVKGQKPALVDFWAAWCGPCRILGPIIEELATEYAGKITVAKLNVDENPKTATLFGIRSIPTVLFFKDGKVAHQAVGVRPKSELKRYLDSLVA